jgi:hypothetical protein
MKKLLSTLALAFLLSSPIGWARGHSRSYTARAYSYRRHRSGIHRSAAAKRAFEREAGYPHGRKAYVVDHIVPLACGGADAPSNMHWQTTADAKAKDKWERKGCK